MHLTNLKVKKFKHTRLIVWKLLFWQPNKQTQLKTSILLCYAMPVNNKLANNSKWTIKKFMHTHTNMTKLAKVLYEYWTQKNTALKTRLGQIYFYEKIFTRRDCTAQFWVSGILQKTARITKWIKKGYRSTDTAPLFHSITAACTLISKIRIHILFHNVKLQGKK